MKKYLITLYVLSLFLLSGCDSSQNFQDDYDEGADSNINYEIFLKVASFSSSELESHESILVNHDGFNASCNITAKFFCNNAKKESYSWVMLYIRKDMDLPELLNAKEMYSGGEFVCRPLNSTFSRLELGADSQECANSISTIIS